MAHSCAPNAWVRDPWWEHYFGARTFEFRQVIVRCYPIQTSIGLDACASAVDLHMHHVDAKVAGHAGAGVRCHGHFPHPQHRSHVREQLFAAAPPNTAREDQYFIEHTCVGMGWGNSARGIWVSAA